MINVLFSDPSNQTISAYYACPQEGELMGQVSPDDPRWATYVQTLGFSPLDGQIPVSLYGGVVTCSPWGVRKALNHLGLRAAVEAAVAASTNQDLKDGWEFATEFRSDDPFVIAMGAALGKTPEETREIILLGSTL